MHKSYFRNFLFPVLLSILVLPLSTAFLSQPEQLEDGFLARLLAQSQQWNEHRGNERVYVQTDKPFYQPGETIWLEAYLRNEEDLKPSRLSHILHVELINPKGSIEKSIRLIAQQGVASGDFSLDSDAPGGIYKLKAYTQWQRNFKHTLLFEKELQVQQTVLPRLKMQLEFVRKAYGPGDRVEATLKLHSLENKPLAHQAVTYQVQLAGEQVEEESSRADAQGVVHLSFSLPPNLTTPDGLLTVLVPHEGGTESISRSIPLVLNQIRLSFYPEGGDLVAGLSGRVAFAAVNEFGKPADITGVVEDEGGKVITYLSSYHQGMGAFTLLPQAGSKYRVRLTKPYGIRQTYPLPEALPEGYSLSTSLPQHDKLDLTLSTTKPGQVAVVMQMRSKVYYSTLLNVKVSSTSLTIPLENVPAGVAHLTLFDGRGVARAERLVFTGKHKRLKLSVATDKEKYLPREKVKMTVRATDEKGLPVPAQLSLAVADDKLLSFADDKSGHILSKLLLEPDLRGEVEEPNFYFDPKEPKADQALDYLLMTRGWRHFTWQEVLSGKLPSVDHAAERAVVAGKVLEPFNGGVAMGATVKEAKGSRQVKTDSLGNFAFPGLDLSQPVLLEVTTASYVRQLWVDDYSREYIIKGEVSGRVVADDGYPLPGVNVLWKGTTQGTVTDVNGSYAIAPCHGCSTLVFSFTGYVSKEVDVSRSSPAQVQLEPDIQALEEVVVTGYATTQRLEGRVYGLSTEAKSARTKSKVPKVRTTRMVPPEAVPDEELVEPGPAQQADKEVPLSWEEVGGDPNADPDIIIEEPGAASLDDPGTETVFQVVEQMPEFPGGMQAMTRFFRDSLYYSYRARRAKVQGVVYVTFLVEASGKVSDVHVLKGLGYGLDQQAVRVVKAMPHWNPGRQSGRPVAVRYSLPIRFSLDNARLRYEGRQGNGAEEEDMMASHPTKYYRARTFAAPIYKTKKALKERGDFRSTIFWQSHIQLDETGKTEIEFYNSDEITTFRATVEGIGESGLVGHEEFTYYTQLPFSLSAKLPVALLMGDTLALPLTLKNNTSAPLTGNLQLSLPGSWKAIKPAPGTIRLESGEARTLYVQYLVQNRPGSEVLGVTFTSEDHSDAIRQEVRTLPRGFPAHQSFSGSALTGQYALRINSPIAGTLRATLTAFPGTLSELLASIESMLQEPHGCFEQTSSSTYPNVLVLRLLKESGQGQSEVLKRAEQYIERGYKRLVSFETPEGGFDWFGQAPGNEALTAYGLLQFTQMQHVYRGVDEEMLKRVRGWLLAKRDGKGGFRRDAEGHYGFGLCDREIADGYLVYVLVKSGERDLTLEATATHAYALQAQDPYLLALSALTHFELGKHVEATKALNQLLSLQRENGSWSGKTHSITRSGGLALELETTALALQAVLASGQPDNLVLRKGINFLSAHRGYGGRFGSTQSTILALEALTAYARYTKQTAQAGTLAFLVNGKVVAKQVYPANAREAICLQGLEKYLTAGEQQVEIRYLETQSPLPYVLDLHWTTTLPQSAPSCTVQLETQLNKRQLKVGETVRLTATLVNQTPSGLPMTMAVLGIPGGLTAQPWQLKELQKKGLADFYETQGNQVYLYFRQLKPNEQPIIQLDLKAELPGTFEASASSAYLYYNDEAKSWSKPERITIRE